MEDGCNMKRLLYILSAILVISGCGKTDGNDKPDLKSQLCGDWQSTTLSVSGKVYLSFNGAGTFEMYQMIGEGAYRLYRGTWNLEEDILTGKYNDGENWAASYSVAIDNKMLTLTSKNDAGEVSKYSSCTVPEEVKNGCEVVVKSEDAGL